MKILLFYGILSVCLFWSYIIMMKSTQSSNLIAQQRSLLQRIYSQGQNLWKVVIFDHYNREINSSLFKMKDLRENNVTLYFHIKDLREQLHGVTAIYLVQPTLENIDLITNDFQEDLYSSVIVHFSSEPQAHLLSTFAKTLARKSVNALTKITKVEYSCLGFHTVGRNVAVAQDNNQLLNVLCALKHRPLFLCGPREQQQAGFLRDRLADSALFAKEELTSIRQPYNLVLLFNRDLDLFPALHHGISYAGLVQGLYRLSANGHRILGMRRKQQGGKEKEGIEVDLNDEMWVQRRNLPTSEMQLQEQFNRLKVRMAGEKERLDEVNELLQKSKKIQTHIHAVDDLIKQAFARKLNLLHQTQMQIYRKRVLNSELKRQIAGLLESSENQQDKVVLILIVLLYCEHVDPKEIEQFQSKVPALKKSRLFNEIRGRLTKDVPDASMIGGSGKLMKKFALGLLSNFKSGDKFLLTKYVQKVRDLRESDLKELGLTLSGLSEVPAEAKIANIIVYVIGGGCLSEEANLSKLQSRAIYLCDRLVSAADLI